MTLTEKQSDNWIRKHRPIGCLAEKHPRLLFGAVSRVDGEFWCIFLGNLEKLPAGTKVRLWNGEIVS